MPSELKMMRLPWLFLVVSVCSTGFGSMCSDSSVCSELSNKDQILDCVHLCPSESLDLSESSQLDYDDDDSDGDDDGGDDDLLLSILLSALASEDESSQSDPNAHSDSRRSYSMEHFRWGKPSGRKRRPIKVFLSSLEGGGSPGSSFPLRARRHLSVDQAEAGKDVLEESRQNQDLLRSRISSRPREPSGLRERKYRMNHFRWGSPPASKQNNRLSKVWEEKPREQLTKFIKNVLMKDVQRIMG